MLGSPPDEKRDGTPCQPVVVAVCPECKTADTVSPLPMQAVGRALYHSCSRCHLVWGTDFAGMPINKH
jgi:hypothetical protein